MSLVTTYQPDGTPTWIDLDVPDIARAREFYRTLFGWEFSRTPTEAGGYTTCLLRGLPVAGLRPAPASEAPPLWRMYFATQDCDDTAKRVVDAGGTLLPSPPGVAALARTALAKDSVGAEFGLWQGDTHPGCQIVNEPASLVRNDLATPAPGPARDFYTAVFGFTLDGNDDLPGFDFTFLRRPDGHEIGGIFGDPGASSSAWQTTFEVADTDALVEGAVAAGGTAGATSDSPYGRTAEITDPFGTRFSVIARPVTTG
ncbi:VOC family protein [Streptomyces sp. ISL-98]|uniref:VOC family protein n=1 Tax=Streptomyces sp. ISL-98 TaxID=2819192 RepID=UPI001BE6452D|nr:VOC family protein [Streptomyces sp. ISL-98]MBT2506037.1 VOC family protein [Streptomyces sp. ISL-98]